MEPFIVFTKWQAHVTIHVSWMLGLIFKKNKLDEAKTLTKIMKEEWLNNPDNQMEEFLIDVGAVTHQVLSSVKVSVEKKQKFLKKHVTFVLYSWSFKNT